MNRRSFLRGLVAAATAAVAPLPLLGEGEAPGPVQPMLARWRWSGRFYDAPALWTTYTYEDVEPVRPFHMEQLPRTVDFTKKLVWSLRFEARSRISDLARLAKPSR